MTHPKEESWNGLLLCPTMSDRYFLAPHHHAISFSRPSLLDLLNRPSQLFFGKTRILFVLTTSSASTIHPIFISMCAPEEEVKRKSKQKKISPSPSTASLMTQLTSATASIVSSTASFSSSTQFFTANDASQDESDSISSHLTTASSPTHLSASEIVAQLSVQDKLRLISGKNMWELSDCLLERYGLPCVRVSDGPHGLRKTVSDLSIESVPATCFPPSAALACSWNPKLLKYIVGPSISREAKQQGVSLVLGPAMNLQRHPCGGRNFEYFSEDPYLAGQFAASMVEGIQSVPGMGACCKHVAANNQESGRFVTDVVVDERTLRELYLHHFQKAIQKAKPMALMCAYNKLNGVPCSEQKWLFDNVIRKEWNFEGLVITDWGATNDRVKGLQAGIDLEMPGSYGAHDEQIMHALASGDLSIQDLNRAATRVVELMKKSKCADGGQVHVDLNEHHELAYQVAMECPVLLKNQDKILPLAKDSEVAVIGAFAKYPRIQGMGSSQVNPFTVDSFLGSIMAHTSKVTYSPGYDPEDAGSRINRKHIREAVKVASESKTCILMVGLPEICESEAYDRDHMSLPLHHIALIDAICQANASTIVVVNNGGPILFPWVDKPQAIIEAFLAGQAGGRALADLVFGVASPSGRLAATIPMMLQDVPADRNFPGNTKLVEYREGLNVGYRYFCTSKVPVRFPFGYGLSYTEFDYGNLEAWVQTDTETRKEVLISFDLSNIGGFTAAETIQCYIHPLDSLVYRPEMELKAFRKLTLQPSQHTAVYLSLDETSFSFYDTGHKKFMVEDGRYEICIGSSCQDIRLRQTIIFESCTDGKVASVEALRTHPPKHLQQRPFSMDDERFSYMMKQPISVLEKNRKDNTNALVSRNTTLNEAAKKSYIGKVLSLFTYFATLYQLPDRGNKKVKRVAKAMVNEMPLRGLVLFSQGNFTFRACDIFIAGMNGFYREAIQMCTSTWFNRTRR